MWLFVNCLVENPTFDSQTKENMTLQQKSFGSTCPLSDKFFKQVPTKTSSEIWDLESFQCSVNVLEPSAPHRLRLVALLKASWTGWSSRLRLSSTRNVQPSNTPKSRVCQSWTMLTMQVMSPVGAAFNENSAIYDCRCFKAVKLLTLHTFFRQISQFSLISNLKIQTFVEK